MYCATLITLRLINLSTFLKASILNKNHYKKAANKNLDF